MLIALIIVSVLLVIMAYFYATTRINNWHLCQEFGEIMLKAHEDYVALEQGRDEETEAYEQQYLSFMETIGNQSNAIDSYIEDLHILVRIAEKHYSVCLPDLADEDREAFEKIKASVLL